MNREELSAFLKGGLRNGLGALREGIAEAHFERVDEAYFEAIEIGVSNTISALHDANVKDDEIIRVMNKYWGIPFAEAEDRLLIEKSESVKASLCHYLKLQGYSEQEIRRFMIHNNVGSKISNNKELWKLKNNPEKLMKAVEENK
ncbi:hypothetical protein SAMN02910413_0275 [Pseudobutyrivibrio sp. C4]|uniref:hypothetical protein n=1 Tax=Pseudobutyrivibrio sp. C4 TaxID=1520803 RepID=UPI0008CBB8DF|nr:hypothetical protein [Pseudobutyrivibrio sp. C4]SES64766.1 hypothetical protein SAMN02910413_0275 [Pseudobutyrivibrio sp. C4]